MTNRGSIIAANWQWTGDSLFHFVCCSAEYQISMQYDSKQHSAIHCSQTHTTTNSGGKWWTS